MDSNEFGFDGEGDDEPNSIQDAATDFIQELEGPVTSETEEAYMEDVDRRLDVASTYRQLLRSPLFESPNASTSIVEAEIREFVVQRLKVLLNMAPDVRVATPAPVVQLPFDEQELKTLKVLLASLAERAAKKAEPSGPAQVAKAPAPAPAPTPPAVRRAVAPAPTKVTPKPPAAVLALPGITNKPRAPKAPPKEENLVELEDPRSGQTILARRPRRQVRSKSAIPMPTGSEMEAILHAQAQGSGAALGANKTDTSITSSALDAIGSQLVQTALNSEE